ncbi:uncharacterized protein LOC113360771 [Papaver somniferum]|uniref:uncharacterized protein LOC113360771 n=1 Tax=Papaver somniferum TaxID=3469 RepID=UPI000E6F5CA6|nr:uncharacterized protein LOC113360771 [Papaver somniferum]
MRRELDKSWMFENDRFGQVYRDGVKNFIKYASTYGPWKTLCPCPCSRCLNGGRLDIKEVQQHLYEYGIDKSYITWVFHGEKQPVNNVMSRPVESVSNEQVREDIFPDLTPFIDAAFEVHGSNGGGVFIDDANGTQDDTEEPFEFEPDAQKRHEKYKELAEQKLYPTCEGNVSTLSAIVELQNLKKQFGISGNCVTKLLKMIKGWLPKEKTMPNRYTEMKSIMLGLGMKCKAIHACPNHCILYYKEHEDETSCLQCKEPRFKVKQGKFGPKKTKEPSLVLRHFPVGERLKRYYGTPWISEAVTWHDRAEVSSEYMRHPIDSHQWALVKKKFPEFA